MVFRSMFAVVVMTAMSSVAGHAADGDSPVCVAKRTSGPVYIDGNSSEQDWSAAQPLTPFVFPWYTDGVKEQTQVKVLWDDEYLYVLFRCEDAHIAAHYYQRNSAPYKDDCVEVFMAPNPDKPLWYANNEINCLGTWLVGMHTDDVDEFVLRDHMLVGRSHEGSINTEDDTDSWWIIEWGIPFSSLVEYGGRIPPAPGDTWGINFNRCGGDVNQQFSQWTASLTERPSFHQPKDFGSIVFSDEAVR
jgi:hypothetical protein